MDKETKSIQISLQDFIGASINAPTLIQNAEFVRKSKEAAGNFEWLYHCTNRGAFLNMLRSREMWLSNLKYVNDKEEAQRIEIPSYESRYFIGCFTYEPNVPEEHWNEYASIEDGIIWAVKTSYFKKQAVLMTTTNEHMTEDFYSVCKNRESAIKKKIELQERGQRSNPYFMDGYGFYKVIYDDALKASIMGESVLSFGSQTINGVSFSPDIPGIIKSTHGMCIRDGKEPYEKDWASEKEVRLKCSIQQLDSEKNGNEFHDSMICDCWFARIAVPFTIEAFKNIRIRLSPKFADTDTFFKELRDILPEADVEVF